MKKLLCLLLCLLCLPTFALAEVDLDSLTFVELIELREQITAEITSRPEWKEVFVPAGVYEVGVDIPAGHWTITPQNDSVSFNYGSALNDTKTNIDYAKMTTTGSAAKAGTSMSDFFGMESVSINLSEGNWIYLDNPSVFTPYIRPSLGF